MKILIAGDFVPRERVLDKIKRKDYADVFADLNPYVDDADFSILNLEAPVVLDYSKASPIQKVGPALSAPVGTIDMIKEAGFNCVTLANNHIMDFGASALNDTISELDSKQILHVGAGRCLDDASKVLYLRTGQQTVAIINFCEHEFSIAEDNTPGAFPLSIVKNCHQIQEAKEHSDFVVVIVHGGHELYQFPSPRMKELYRYYVEIGADAVINHHQHCYCGYEVYRDRPIFYGLGNLCFDVASRRKTNWNFGFFVVLSFDTNIGYNVIPYSQGLSSPGVKIMSDTERKSFFENVERLNMVINNDNLLINSFNVLLERKRSEMYYRLSRYHGRAMRFMYHHHLLPKLFGKKWALKMINLIDCESQRDLVSQALNTYVSNDKD